MQLCWRVVFVVHHDPNFIEWVGHAAGMPFLGDRICAVTDSVFYCVGRDFRESHYLFSCFDCSISNVNCASNLLTNSSEFDWWALISNKSIQNRYCSGEAAQAFACSFVASSVRSNRWCFIVSFSKVVFN
ncbi:MAG: hypothetical protein [Circular genetic element sp.]|nr:MAG: hypothetical protein [Circular genetic element sp.]